MFICARAQGAHNAAAIIHQRNTSTSRTPARNTTSATRLEPRAIDALEKDQVRRTMAGVGSGDRREGPSVEVAPGNPASALIHPLVGADKVSASVLSKLDAFGLDVMGTEASRLALQHFAAIEGCGAQQPCARDCAGLHAGAGTTPSTAIDMSKAAIHMRRMRSL
jgi:hypothetical protein